MPCMISGRASIFWSISGSSLRARSICALARWNSPSSAQYTASLTWFSTVFSMFFERTV